MRLTTTTITTTTFNNPTADSAEIHLGTIPGAGGTQRLPRLVGKSLAMEMVLAGRSLDAAEARRRRIVSRVVAGQDQLRRQILDLAEKIAASDHDEDDECNISNNDDKNNIVNNDNDISDNDINDIINGNVSNNHNNYDLRRRRKEAVEAAFERSC